MGWTVGSLALAHQKNKSWPRPSLNTNARLPGIYGPRPPYQVLQLRPARLAWHAQRMHMGPHHLKAGAVWTLECYSDLGLCHVIV